MGERQKLASKLRRVRERCRRPRPEVLSLGLCVLISIGDVGAVPSVEKRWFEHMDKLVERAAFIDSLKVKSTELKDQFLLEAFTALYVTLMVRFTPRLTFPIMRQNCIFACRNIASDRGLVVFWDDRHDHEETSDRPGRSGALYGNQAWKPMPAFSSFQSRVLAVFFYASFDFRDIDACDIFPFTCLFR